MPSQRETTEDSKASKRKRKGSLVMTHDWFWLPHKSEQKTLLAAYIGPGLHIPHTLSSLNLPQVPGYTLNNLNSEETISLATWADGGVTLQKTLPAFFLKYISVFLLIVFTKSWNSIRKPGKSTLLLKRAQET